MSLAEFVSRDSMEGRRRITLLDRMSPLDDGRSSFGGLTLDAILGAEKTASSADHPSSTPTRCHRNRTLLDIINEENRERESNRDKRTWRTFRDKLRLKRAAGAWTSSEILPGDSSSQRFDRQESLVHSADYSTGTSRGLTQSSESSLPSGSAEVTRSLESFLSSSVASTGELNHSNAVESIRPLEPSVSNSTALTSDSEEPIRPLELSVSRSTEATGAGDTGPNPSETNHPDGEVAASREPTRRLGLALAEERAQSEREAEAAAVAAGVAPAAWEAEPVRMALIDLLEETDRQGGTLWSRYAPGDDGEEGEEGEEGVGDVFADVAITEEGDDVAGVGGGINCCVCMVRSKGAAFIPCGHTFCRLCSRELWVRRGNCPLCNGAILEILDIF